MAEVDLALADWREAHVPTSPPRPRAHGLTFTADVTISIERVEVLHVIGRAAREEATRPAAACWRAA